MTEVRFEPAGALRGSLRPPPDKSVSHRAAILAAMADGEATITGYLDAADTRSTLAGVQAVGAEVSELGSGNGAVDLKIRGVGLRGAKPAAIDVGNAGTLMRILPGWLAGQPSGEWRLDGDESIRRRPVDRIAEPLRLMGAGVEAAHGFLPPLTVTGAPLSGMDYELPVASAQVKSCLMLAALLAEGETTLTEPEPSRDHTERMLKRAGAAIETSEGRVVVGPAERLDPPTLQIHGDFSSAAFFLVAALLVPGSEVQLSGVGVNPTRTGLLAVTDRMGADIELVEPDEIDGEPVAGLIVRHGALGPTEVTNREIPLTIDELPLVGLLGCFAEGETVVMGAAELRHKESDRLAAVVDALGDLGGEVESRRDGFVVHGTGGLRGGWLDARGDHRLAMLGAVAGLASTEGVTVDGMEAAAVSYPGFDADLGTLFA